MHTHPNNCPLPNLPLVTKLVYTTTLLFGLGAFLGSWAEIIQAVYGAGSDGSALGIVLGMLAWERDFEFRRLIFLHLAGIIAIVVPSLWLFRMTAIRRRVRMLIVGSVAIAVLLDLAGWLYAPQCSSSNLFVGYIAILAGAALVALAMTCLSQMWIYIRWQSPFGRPARVVVVGGGFAGLYAARGLHRRLGYSPDLELTVIDKNNFFLFPPLLPSAATGSIETLQVSYPFRRIFETTNIRFRKLEVSSIDPQRKAIVAKPTGDDSADPIELQYDYLVLAPGSAVQTFKTKGADEHAFFLRELEDAVRLRNHVIERFERAAVVQSPERQREELRFVVVGAGPTGIEIATELYDLIHHILLARYPEIDHDAPQITLVQSGTQVLPGWEDSIVQATGRQLAHLKMDVRLGERVVEVSPAAVTLASGTILAARTVVWCAGVRPSPLIERSGLTTHRSGRVEINEDLRSGEYPEIFVLGDVAYLTDSATGGALPPLGQVAVQQGMHAGKNLAHLLRGKAAEPFKYFNYGSLVSIGEHKAAIQVMGIKLSGFFAWIIWRSLYLTKIVGVSNKIRVMVDWTLDLLIERSFTQIGPDRGSHPVAQSEREPEHRSAATGSVVLQPSAAA